MAGIEQLVSIHPDLMEPKPAVSLDRVFDIQRIDHQQSVVRPSTRLVRARFLTTAELLDPPQITDNPILDGLQRLCEHAYGYRTSPGERRLSRGAPSAGAMYPTELVWIVDICGHWEALGYDFGAHGFRRMRTGNSLRLGSDLDLAPCAVGLLVVSVAWRTVQRYGVRGYRYCLLDAGNVLGNLEVLARSVGAPLKETYPNEGYVEQNIQLCYGEMIVASAQFDAGSTVRLRELPPHRVAGESIPQWRNAEESPILAPALARVVALNKEARICRSFASVIGSAITEMRTPSRAVINLCDRVSARGFSGAVLDDDRLDIVIGAAYAGLAALPAELREVIASAVVSARGYRAAELPGGLPPDRHIEAAYHRATTDLAAVFGNQPLLAGTDVFLVIGLAAAEVSASGVELYRRILLAAGVIGARVGRTAVDALVPHTIVGGFHDAELLRLTGGGVVPLVVHAFGDGSLTVSKNDADAADQMHAR
jgi:hypothetical protein